MTIDPVYNLNRLCDDPVLPGSNAQHGDTKERNQVEQDDKKSSDYGTLW